MELLLNIYEVSSIFSLSQLFMIECNIFDGDDEAPLISQQPVHHTRHLPARPSGQAAYAPP